MIFRKSSLSDLDEIWAFVHSSIVKMISGKKYQWDDIYLTRADFETDIMKGELTVGFDEKSGKLVCIYVINSQHILCSEMVFFISSSFSKESSQYGP